MSGKSFCWKTGFAVLLPVLVLTGAILFGGPVAPPVLDTLSEPFGQIDFSAAPPLSRYAAGDGQALAYRHYQPHGTPRASVVLVHGSTGSSLGMHPLAEALAAAGYSAYALDIRGHGDSGRRGTIGYIGQLEDDLVAFMQEVAPVSPATLLGMSAGGGFTLRFAGSERQSLFDSYVMLAPLISHKADNYRPAAGGWVEVGMPRIVALTMLESVGVSHFSDLPVVRFAVDPESRVLTPAYSFKLQSNFRPHMDYQADIAAVQSPVAVLAGGEDELFYSSKLEGIFRQQNKSWPVRLLPGMKHIDISLVPEALTAVVQVVDELNTGKVTQQVVSP